MDRSLNIQTSGAVLVLAVFISAEAAAWYLIACPSCSLAWYLNLGPFHIFETARGSPSALHYLFTSVSLPIAVAALLIVALAWHFQVRFLIALAANLSFAFVAALVDADLRARPGALVEPLFSTFLKHDFALALAVLSIASFVSCVASHASFIAEILSETKHKRSARGRSAMSTPRVAVRSASSFSSS